MKNRNDWTTAPIVFVAIPTCPACGCEKYQRTRTLDNGDNSRTKLVVCRQCATAFKIVAEPNPESGH